MRIFLLIRSLERGGAERQFVAVANGLAARGHHVTVAQFYSGGALESELACTVRLVDLKKCGRWDVPAFCARLVRAVRDFGPDVIYSFLGTSNLLAAVLRPFWKGARVVWSVRASDMDLSRYDSTARLSARLERLASRFADRIIANSTVGADFAVAQGMPGDGMTVVPNGIDTDIYCPDREAGMPLREEWGIGPDDVLIGLVARIDPMKDHETFLRAARLVADKDPAVRFVCVGGGDSEYVQEMQAVSASLDMAGTLTWAGELAYMNGAYNALDICCLSSITEGFPNVVGEAMSCGVPCVVTDVGDGAVIVGETGMVVPKRNPERLAEALLEMVSRVREGRDGDPRQRIADNFSLAAMIEKTETVLQDGVS